MATEDAAGVSYSLGRIVAAFVQIAARRTADQVLRFGGFGSNDRGNEGLRVCIEQEQWDNSVLCVCECAQESYQGRCAKHCAGLEALRPCFL